MANVTSTDAPERLQLLRVLGPAHVWALGVGIVLVTAIGWAWFRQALDLPALMGMGLIMAGGVVINLFSKTVVH